MAEIKKIDDIKYDFKDLTPFKWYVLENFPFIEADFDALTNWQLLCKLGRELNKVIDSQNSVGAQVEILTTAFNNLNHAFGEFTDDMLDKFATFKNETNENMNNFTTRITNQITDFENTSNTNYGQFTSQITKSFQELQDYVENYFKNLNVQDEINTKLDEMVQDGSFQKLVEEAIKQSDIENIIKSYLTNVVYGYDTLSNLKAVNSIEAGNIARTLGNQTMTDGKGSYYKIRTKTTSDVVDEDKIVSLTNFPNLVAEKIEETGTAVETNENPFDVPTICIGDEYITGINGDDQIVAGAKGWADYYKEYAGLSDENFFKAGGVNYGFFGKPNSQGESVEAQRFEHCLTQYKGDKSKVKRIIVLGGLNDAYDSISEADLQYRINTFISSCINLYPNAKVYIGMCSNMNGDRSESHSEIRKDKLVNIVFPNYKSSSSIISNGKYFTFYIKGIETALKNYDAYMNTNSNNPTNNGYKQLGKSIIQYFNEGNCAITIPTQILKSSNFTCSVSSALFQALPVNLVEVTTIDGINHFHIGNITIMSENTAVNQYFYGSIASSTDKLINVYDIVNSPNITTSFSTQKAISSGVGNDNYCGNFTINCYDNVSLSMNIPFFYNIEFTQMFINDIYFTIPAVNC